MTRIIKFVMDVHSETHARLSSKTRPATAQIWLAGGAAGVLGY